MKRSVHLQLLLICLLLLGAQAVQNSPLHDHSDDPPHAVDCTLCHFQDHVLVPNEPTAHFAYLDRKPLLPEWHSPLLLSLGFNFFQSRAPPFSTV